jgi:predicted dehydrogenase
MLKVGIIGCGKIAEAHASQIQRIEGCEIVGVCDREELMARQLAERFGIRHVFDSAEAFLRASRPDIVHITTPPQSHLELGKLCMDSGSHIYVEKPFSLNTEEAEQLLDCADEKGLKVTVGHDVQFSHVARRLRQTVSSGYLGGPPVHMESYYSYNLGKDGYARALLGDSQHWVRRLPGGLLQNIISHGIARIAELLATDHPVVIAHGFVSPRLRSMGEEEIVDELRVIISGEGQTAYFTFSSQMRPALNQFRVYGRQNGLVLDQGNETLFKLKGGRYNSYAEHFISPLVLAQQCIGNVTTNIREFLRNDFHMKAGMKHLIEAFYKSVTNGSTLPIPYREIVLTSRIMDAIFSQIGVNSRRRVGLELAPMRPTHVDAS